jgi:hypothetical protein
VAKAEMSTADRVLAAINARKTIGVGSTFRFPL